MHEIYYLNSPWDRDGNLNQKQLQNIEKNLDILNEKMHIYLTNNALCKMMDVFFKNIYDKLSIRCKRDVELFTLLKKKGSLVMYPNLYLKKNILDLIESNTSILLLYEDNILKCKRKILGCLCWSQKNHPFWDDCLSVIRKRIIQLLSCKLDKSCFNDMDEHWLSASDVMTHVWNDKYRLDKSFVLLDNNVYTDYVVSSHYLDFKVWF